MSGDIVVPLTKQISAHGKDVDELTLREPTATDVMDLGYPFLIVTGDDDKDSTRIELRPKVTGKYITRLAGIPPSSVAQLCIPDLQTMQSKVMGFFGKSVDGAPPSSSNESAST